MAEAQLYVFDVGALLDQDRGMCVPQGMKVKLDPQIVIDNPACVPGQIGVDQSAVFVCANETQLFMRRLDPSVSIHAIDLIFVSEIIIRIVRAILHTVLQLPFTLLFKRSQQGIPYLDCTHAAGRFWRSKPPYRASLNEDTVNSNCGILQINTVPGKPGTLCDPEPRIIADHEQDMVSAAFRESGYDL